MKHVLLSDVVPAMRTSEDCDMQSWVQSRELASVSDTEPNSFTLLRLHLITMDPFFNDGYDLPYNSNARFSQSECTYMNHAQASEVSVNMPSRSASVDPTPQSISPLSGPKLSTITSASHEVLIRSGNAAYASVHELHLQAKYELQAQRSVVSSYPVYTRIYLLYFLQESRYTAPGCH
jgi:hypothetical protein